VGAPPGPKDEEELSVLLVTRSGRGVVVPGLEKWPSPTGSFGDLCRTLGDVTCRVLPAATLLYEREHHHRWSGREVRPKDIASIQVLRELARG
jgi:hypothetical protein